MTMIRYEYSDDDLLVQKPAYNFSAFHGPAFLQVFQGARREWSGRLATGTTILSNRGADLVAVGRDGSMSLASYLDASSTSALLRIVHRFEVSKRLWTLVDVE